MAFIKDAKGQVRFFGLSQRNFPVEPSLTKDGGAQAVCASAIAIRVMFRFRGLLRVFFPANQTKIDNCHFGFGFHSGDDSGYGIGAMEESIVIQTDDVFPLRLSHKKVTRGNKPTVLIKPE
jgi:hypothetical protein